MNHASSYAQRENAYKTNFSIYKQDAFMEITSDYKYERFNYFIEIIKLCEQNRIGKVKTIEIWDGYKNVKHDISSLDNEECVRITKYMKEIPININNYTDLFYYLFVILLFYAPFLIVLPLKWIIDGYKKEVGSGLKKQVR